jgi:predicted dehydrogenase
MYAPIISYLFATLLTKIQHYMHRRNFIKNSSLATAGFALLPGGSLFAQGKKIKMGIIGTGLRGQDHLELLLKRNDTDVVAICDIDAQMIVAAQKLFTNAGRPLPKIFTGSNTAYEALLQVPEIEAVIIATPWEWHAPMCIAALQAKKYVGTEVVLGITLQDHWNVVKACEDNNGHLMMLENVCYRRDVMAVLNMVRQGLFGELIHLQGGYQHDLRGVKFNDGKTPYDSGAEFGEKGFSEARWRTRHSQYRNGDLYPTHGIGPIANYIDINRGNRFVNLCSFASKARGLHNYVVKKGGENHPNTKVDFKLGDVVTTSISTSNGETILLQHDTNLPRPYSLGFRVQGTKGIWMDVNHSVHLEGISEAHRWEDTKTYFEQYDHPLWKKYAADANGAGHGGMDFFVLNAFVESVKRKIAPPMDVYDAAAWSAITPLSEQSISLGNQTVDFPDFTGGQWMYRQPQFALGDDY